MRIFRQLFKGAGDKRDAFEQEEMALDARIMLAQGKKEQAINLVRQKSGMNEKEAARYVASLEQNAAVEASPLQTAPNDAMKFAARDLLAQGKKIQAVKLVKEQTGWGLKQAKEFVDSLA